jgi:hypothetical protein
MSTKFEQLLDLIVNEEMDKANELFHEIVVEKSRNIYENLIAQEAADDEDMEESTDEDMEESTDEDMEESADEGDMDESIELEDSYMMDGDDDEMPIDPSGEEETDDLETDVSADDDMGGEMSGDDEVEYDIRDAIEQLQAALDKLEGNVGMDSGDEFDSDMGPDMGPDMDSDMEPDELKMGMPMESKKRMTREYVEKVGNDWEKSGSMKGQKQHVGAGTGDTESAPNEGKSPIASGANKPGPAGVNGRNLNQGATEGQTNTGTSPGKVTKGINPTSGEKFASGINNVDGKKSGVKTLSNVKGGHGPEKKGAGPGPVGSGTGDKAGQTSTPAVKQFLKPYSK